ncbi:ABC transporter ATP-binding protein [Aestuariivirga sp. YIM B02566]|uniref:ABC transporter ATP-binding protein n=1 Tax=Taklimakanibacter albus TaxID=2800327 RepID=A0ACC5R8N1_9HYPH|nr:ABC transporter ATP-binding protein [Aestuariivirga sp. YIM B02566]
MTMAARKILATFRDVAKSYDGRTTAVRDLNLDICEGEFLTLLGPSGSGKTSTLMMLAGFEAPSRGEIIFQGKALNALPPHQRNFGVVFQDYALFPHLTVAENLAYPLRFRATGRAETEERVGKALSMLQLDQFRDRYPRQLSGGQQQRVALGRALIFDPHLVLMDEPLGALDRQLRERMQMEIKHLHKRLGISFISVTHDQGEALTMSDRIAVFNDGTLQQIGSPQDLYETPANAFVARFIGDSNFLSGHVAAIRGDAVLVECQDGLKITARNVDCGAVGSAALISVRPERVRPGAVALGEHNHAEGSVLEHVYFGDATRIRLRVADSTEFLVKLPAGDMPSGAEVGKTIKLSWSRAHCHAFAKE